MNEIKQLSSEDIWSNDTVPDIRKQHKASTLHSSGAEALFCDTSSCKRERDKLLILAGEKETGEHVLFELAEKMANDILDQEMKIARKTEELDALVSLMGYDIHRRKYAFCIKKDNSIAYFPNYETWKDSI